MIGFIKTKVKKSDDHNISKLIFLRLIIAKFIIKGLLFHEKKVCKIFKNQR